MSEVWYHIDSPGVIFELFDDELVAIHLDTGAYHSLVGAAADAFQLLAQDASASELAHALATKYDASAAKIEETLTPFLAALEAEKLIVRVATRQAHPPLELAPVPARLPFGAPSLQAYHDLQSLFLLDPVHEVGEQGWPQARTEAPGSDGEPQ